MCSDCIYSKERKPELIEDEQRDKGRLIESKFFPGVILLDTTSFCNLKCSMCGHKDMSRKKGIMKWRLFTKLVDEIAKENKNARVWMVFFGEALLLKNKNNHNIYEMIKYAKRKGLSDVVLNSNGNLMDKEASKNLIASGLDAIYIGIDAFDIVTYSKIRVGGRYDKVLKNILCLLELKKEMKVDYPHVYVQFVEMGENKGEVNGFVDFWKSHGAKVKIRPKVSWAGKVLALNLDLPYEERWSCYWAMRTLSITDQGKVVLCAVDVDAQFVVGDVNKQSIKEVWNARLKEIRKLHLEKRFNELPNLCKNCKDWQAARAEFV